MSSLQAFSPVATEQAFALWRVQRRAGRWFVSIMQPGDVDAWELAELKRRRDWPGGRL